MSDPWAEKAAMLWKMFGPIILMTGFTANVLTLLVLHNVEEKHSSHLYFKVLAASDLMYLAVEGLTAWVRHTFGVNVQDGGLAVCVMQHWLHYSLEMLSYHVVAALTLQRALQAYRGVTLFQRYHAHSGHTFTVTCTAVASIVVFCCVYNLYTPFVLTYRGGKCSWKEVISFRPMICLNALLYILLPLAVIVASNVYLIEVLRTKMAVTSTFLRTSRITLAAMVMSAVFVVLSLPAAVWTLVYTVDPLLISSSPMRFFRELAQLIMVLNSAIKFFIYRLIGPNFKNQTRSFFSKCKRKTGNTQVVPERSDSQGEDVYDF